MKPLIKYLIAAAVTGLVIVSGLMAYAWVPGISLERALARKKLSVGDLKKDPANVSIRIYKKAKRLELLYRGEVVNTYRVSTGPGIPPGEKPPDKVGDKELFRRGLRYWPGDKKAVKDLRTPEGRYYLVYDFRPSRVNYRFALISYPDGSDRKESNNPGGAIGIHGIYHPLNYFGRLHTWVRHTRGCISLNNREIDELDKVVGKGTAVEILP